MSIKRTELIDGYLRGELGEQEMQAFNKELSSDPVFSEEVNFQRQIANGLGEFRKAELKARLNAVDLTTPWWEVGHFINPTLIKTTGAIVTAAIIGTGIYYYNSLANEVVSDVQTVHVKDLKSIEVLDADQPLERPEIPARLPLRHDRQGLPLRPREPGRSTASRLLPWPRDLPDPRLALLLALRLQEDGGG